MGYANQRQQSGPSYTYDNGYKTDQGWQNRNSFGGYVGGADDAVNRYRGLGDEKDQRAAYQGNYTNANQSRDAQYESLQDQRDAAGLALDAARGNGPSQAEILGKQMTERALAGQTAAAASARGGAIAQAAAMRSASNGAAAFSQQAQQQAMAQRAQEMAVARGQAIQGTSAVQQGATGIRGQDLETVAQQQQAELAQRQMNQQAQEYYEGLGYQTNVAQLNANQQAQNEADQSWAANRAATMGDEHFGFGKLMQYGGMAAGAATGGLGAGMMAAGGGGSGGEGGGDGDFGSDERMKMNIGQPGGTMLLGGSGGLDVMGSLRAQSDFATNFARHPAMMMSDARAKRDAHDLGYARGAADAEAAVAARRAAGGYAQLDMTPIPAGAGSGYVSDAERAQTARLHGAIEQSVEGANAYEPMGPTFGVGGAPRGYAASRAGQPGDMFGAEYDANGNPVAPGTVDYERTQPKGKGHKGALGVLGSVFSGMSGGMRNTMVSDDRAKVRAAQIDAFREGMNYGSARATDSEGADSMRLPAYMPNEYAPSPPRALVVTHAPAAREKVISRSVPWSGSDDDEAPAAPVASPPASAPRAPARAPAPTSKKPPTGKKTSAADPMQDANRAMAAASYEYLPEYTPQGQRPGEVNVGPIAQNMAADPVASTAVVQRPDGMLAIDKEKALKLALGGVASAQQQIDDQQAEIDAFKARRRRSRRNA